MLSEVDREIMEDMGYEYGNEVIGEGFAIFLELGIAQFIKNKTTLREDLEKAKLTILDEYPEVAKKEIEIIKKLRNDLNQERNEESESYHIKIVINIIAEIAEEYGGRTPKIILATQLSDRYNMDEETVERTIKTLKRKGIIFEPQQGYLKIA